MIFILSESTDMGWAERYTRSSYKPKPQKEIVENYDWYIKELEKYGSITINHFGETVQLSYNDSIKFLKCLTCNKEFVNNARQYCLSCEYFTSKF